MMILPSMILPSFVNFAVQSVRTAQFERDFLCVRKMPCFPPSIFHLPSSIFLGPPSLLCAFALNSSLLPGDPPKGFCISAQRLKRGVPGRRFYLGSDLPEQLRNPESGCINPRLPFPLSFPLSLTEPPKTATRPPRALPPLSVLG